MRLLKLNHIPWKSYLTYLITQRLGLLFLVTILVAITASIIKPEFYLLGWDNFSSYLNLKNSLFHTIFATWREHRGLGVPSDAEVNDIFRQVFSLIVSPFVGKQLVDQFYVSCMVWGGVLGMYALGRFVSQKLKHQSNQQELFGFLAAFFYLFNLSTLAVFYFPMIMYVTRFFMLPTTILILLKFIDQQSISKSKYILYLILLFIGFGSYMVPTIFIVMMIVFGLMVLILEQKKRLIAIMIFYIALNLYWLLPFANYTIQKGNIVPYAPTFVEINEAMLNKPKSYYSFERQAKMRPSFFESLFSNAATNISQPLHELTNSDEKGYTRWILWIFPIAYLAGIGLTLWLRKDRIMTWFSVTTLVFLILSLKEYSLFGVLYGFLADFLPFANTIFRFGDTKFHAIVAFGGSIMSAYALVWLLDRMVRYKILTRLIYLIIGVVIISHLVIYKSYANGNFIGFFFYNQIPSAYFEIADIINKDPEPIRVIQLPFDSHSYWKPYSWGYFGSAFLHFMLNKPIFDRSFEPASLENADIHKQILDMLQMTASVPTDDLLDKRSDDFYQLLRSLSVKYIIDDQTVSVHNEARNITYWGTIRPLDSARLLSYLEKKGNVQLVKHFDVDADEYSEKYASLYPYNKKQQDYDNAPRRINLYAILDPEPRITFLPEVNTVHSSQKFLPSAIKKSLGHYIQREEYNKNALLFPFVEDQGTKQIENNHIKVSLPLTLPSGAYVFESNNDTQTPKTYVVNVYAQKMESVMRVYFENTMFPTIEGEIGLHPKAYQTIDLAIERDDYRYLNIGDGVFPIKNTSPDVQFIGSVILRDNSVSVGLLYPSHSYVVSNHLVQLESNPHCQNDALENPSLHIAGDNGVLNISGQNVSGCLTTEIATPELLGQSNRMPYVELEFETMGKSDGLPVEKHIDTEKPKLIEYINTLGNPLIMHVCVKPNGSPLCANKASLYQIKDTKEKYVVPIVGDMAYIDKFLVTFAVRSNQRQTYETKTTNIVLKAYASGQSENFSIAQPDTYIYEYTLERDNTLNLLIPIAQSNYSQSIDIAKDGILIGRDESCDVQNKYQVTKRTSNGMLALAVGCKSFINRNIPFSSSNYYLWYASYKHLSGTIPTLILMDKFNTYMYERLNPLDINPNNYFSLPLWQKPESFLESLLLDTQTISKMLSDASAYVVSGYVKPKFDQQDHNNKEFIVQHSSQNEGIAELQNISLIELPNYWAESRIRPSNYQPVKFDYSAQVVSYKRMLPSLWQVIVNSERDGEYLTLFNEQYDNQWILLNVPTLFHAKCDGYVNCYSVKLSAGLSRFYLFYIPELLSFVGIILTSLAIFAGPFFLTWNKKKNQIEQYS